MSALRRPIREGGPGSGVGYRNTVPMEMPISDYISVGTRKGLLDNGHWDEHEIPLNMITKVAQKNYVPDKVNRLMKNRDVLKNKPIDVLWVRGDGYHMIDGHHRYLAAKGLNIDSLPARVFTKAEKSMPDYVGDNQDKEDEMATATRTTGDAANPGLENLKQAAESMRRGDWNGCLQRLTEADDNPLEDLNALLGSLLSPSSLWPRVKREELALFVGGEVDEDGNISWKDQGGKHVLSFSASNEIAMLQDITGVYKQEKASDRLYKMMTGFGDTLESVQEAFIGFKNLVGQLKQKKNPPNDPKAVAAVIGRKKYGSKGFANLYHPEDKMPKSRRLNESAYKAFFFEAFEDWQKKRVKNPETGNEVFVGSLPPHEQEKYRPKKDAPAKEEPKSKSEPKTDEKPKAKTSASGGDGPKVSRTTLITSKEKQDILDSTIEEFKPLHGTPVGDAIQYWSSEDGYEYIRGIQKGNPPKSKIAAERAQEALKALEDDWHKLPDYEGPLAREIAVPVSALKQFAEGKEFTLDAHSSFTAASRGYLEGSSKNNIVRLIVDKSKKGKCIWGLSEIQGECEVLVPKNQKYSISKTETTTRDNQKVTNVYLQEL